MPFSPSMNVIADRQEAVAMYAGSYVIRPKSSSLTLMLRSSVARIVSSSIGISYCFPVRLSVMVRLSFAVGAPAPSCCCVCVVMALLSRGCRGVLRPGAWAEYPPLNLVPGCSGRDAGRLFREHPGHHGHRHRQQPDHRADRHNDA